MQVVIGVNPHEGMCRLEMKLHGYVLINAISFHQHWLLWHFVPSKRGDKTYQFCLCQLKADIQLQFQDEVSMPGWERANL